jgi:hypothetical protein
MSILLKEYQGEHATEAASGFPKAKLEMDIAVKRREQRWRDGGW